MEHQWQTSPCDHPILTLIIGEISWFDMPLAVWYALSMNTVMLRGGKTLPGWMIHRNRNRKTSFLAAAAPAHDWLLRQNMVPGMRKETPPLQAE